jgi:uncharacterized protein with HEPN domain
MVLRVYQFCDAGKELARQLGPQTQDVPWAEIAKMRDLLGHHYWRVNPDVVWVTATRDIPQLEGFDAELRQVCAPGG